jgi:hypothetical protein
MPMKERQNRLAKRCLLFLKENTKWWLIPIIFVFLMLLGLVILSSTSVVPLMYSF